MFGLISFTNFCKCILSLMAAICLKQKGTGATKDLWNAARAADWNIPQVNIGNNR